MAADTDTEDQCSEWSEATEATEGGRVLSKKEIVKIATEAATQAILEYQEDQDNTSDDSQYEDEDSQDEEDQDEKEFDEDGFEIRDGWLIGANGQ